MYERDYAVTLTSTATHLDAFEDALDSLGGDSVLLGSVETGCAALVFTVTAVDPADAVETGIEVLRDRGVSVPDGASVSVLQHEIEGAA